MIELSISESNGKHVLLKDKLENLSIAQKIVSARDSSEPTLRDGKITYSGFDSIFSFLEEQELFVKQWYECRCGNHGDD